MNLQRTISPAAAIVVLSATFLSSALHASPKKLAPIVSAGADGKLTYDVDAHGNRVPDFSTCGYAGGNRQIPDAPVRVVVPPSRATKRRASRRLLITSPVCRLTQMEFAARFCC